MFRIRPRIRNLVRPPESVWPLQPPPHLLWDWDDSCIDRPVLLAGTNNLKEERTCYEIQTRSPRSRSRIWTEAARFYEETLGLSRAGA